jgi:hypothetical protein
MVEVAEKHPGLTTVRAAVTVESEGVLAELATCAWPNPPCSGTARSRQLATGDVPIQTEVSTGKERSGQFRGYKQLENYQRYGPTSNH